MGRILSNPHIVYGSINSYVAQSVNPTANVVFNSLVITQSASFEENITVNGNLTVNGTISNDFTPQYSFPLLLLGGLVNISTITQKRSKLLKIGNEYQLWATLEITPISGDINTQFNFTIPDKVNNLILRSDITGMVSGWKEGLEVSFLQNTGIIGIPASTEATVKFQAVDNGPHYLQINLEFTK